MQTSNPVQRPVCTSTNVAVWKARSLDRDLTPEDFQISDSRYGVTLKLYRCGTYSFIFAERSEIADLTGYYERLVDPGYGEGAAHRTLQMRWLLQLGLKARGKTRTVLEIGAGTGVLVAEAFRAGLDAVGVEPSKSLVGEALRVHGVRLVQGAFPHPELAGRKFDRVFLVDVIEHVDDPVGLLEACANALEPDGVMIVATPNVSSLAARVLGRRWWRLRLAHAGCFHTRSMREACGRAGTKIDSVRTAKWFFPVGYLTERTAGYLPLGPLNGAAESVRPLRWLYGRVVRLNLFDSSVFLLTRKG